jgi:DNA-directed RNA polymerase subunit RPC12/RpoP
MIRFSCARCGKALRAPESMAGKRGKCAQCGVANLVPVVTAVDVRRAAPATPFRDADAPPRDAIESVVELSSGVRFADTVPASGQIVDRPGDFFDQIAPRLGSVTDPLEGPPAVEPLVAPAPPPRRWAPDADEPLGNVATDTYDLGPDDQDEPRGRAAAVWGALLAGAAAGFLAGFIVARSL